MILFSQSIQNSPLLLAFLRQTWWKKVQRHREKLPSGVLRNYLRGVLIFECIRSGTEKKNSKAKQQVDVQLEEAALEWPTRRATREL